MSCATPSNKADLGCTVFQSAQLRIDGILQSADTVPVPVNLTGKTMRACIREKTGSKDVIATVTSGSGITFTDAAAGKYSVIFTATMMAGCEPNRSYLLVVDYFTTGSPDTLEVVWWTEFKPEAQINPDTPT